MTKEKTFFCLDLVVFRVFAAAAARLVSTDVPPDTEEEQLPAAVMKSGGLSGAASSPPERRLSTLTPCTYRRPRLLLQHMCSGVEEEPSVCWRSRHPAARAHVHAPLPAAVRCWQSVHVHLREDEAPRQLIPQPGSFHKERRRPWKRRRARRIVRSL